MAEPTEADTKRARAILNAIPVRVRDIAVALAEERETVWRIAEQSIRDVTSGSTTDAYLSALIAAKEEKQ